MSEMLKTTASGGMLYDPSLAGKPGEEIFDESYWLARGRLRATAGGRGKILFVDAGQGRSWVLRHYHRGGFVARLFADQYLWMGATRTRSFREWRLLHTLARRGLPVPSPVAARYCRSGFWYRADLITAELPPSRTLAEAITGARLPDETWQAVGRTIGRFLRAGVHHADLNAHNILLAADHAVFVLDFDRGRLRPRGPWEGAVLARLRRSLEKIRGQRRDARFHESDWQLLAAACKEEADGG